MNKHVMALMGAALALAAGVASASDYSREPTPATGEKPDPHAWQRLVHDAGSTAAAFKQADPGMTRFFTSATGYAIFPSVGKGAVGIGGAYGTGVLFERGEPTGRSTLTQVTIGAQLGGQSYSEVVFFETPEALAKFKKGELTMAAQLSAVAAASGAAENANYAQGVAVFTLARAGLMAEASVGGQRFAFTPVAKGTSLAKAK